MRRAQSDVRRAGGFTLVEIMSAMALAVLVMVGVAQIFKMSSEAVSEAQAASDAYQLGRGAMNMLQRDLARQVTGYVCAIPGEVHTRVTLSRQSYTVRYRFDALMFPAVGTFEEMGVDPPGGQRPAMSTGAEIVYVVAGRATSGQSVLPYVEVDPNKDDDPRTMLLVRKAFLMSGTPEYAGYSSPGLAVNSEVTAGRGCLTLMAADRWNDGAFAKYRVSPAPILDSENAVYQPLVHVEPQVDASGFPVYEPDVNIVVCDRVSEFVVETWEHDRRGRDVWCRLSDGEPYRRRGLWCENGRNPGNNYQRFTPKMIRVTLVVHPHNDTALLRQQSYAGNIQSGYPAKYRGTVFREVFRVNGLVASH